MSKEYPPKTGDPVPINEQEGADDADDSQESDTALNEEPQPLPPTHPGATTQGPV